MGESTAIFRRPNPIEQPPPIHFPEDGFNHPFQESDGLGPREGKEHPRTVSIDSSRATPVPYISPQIVELRMCALSNRIREEPDWWEKMKDEAIAEKWREEALQQGEDGEQPAWNLTSGMVSLVSFGSSCHPQPSISRSSTCSRSSKGMQLYVIPRPESRYDLAPNAPTATRLTQHWILGRPCRTHLEV